MSPGPPSGLTTRYAFKLLKVTLVAGAPALVEWVNGELRAFSNACILNLHNCQKNRIL